MMASHKRYHPRLPFLEFLQAVEEPAVEAEAVAVEPENVSETDAA